MVSDYTLTTISKTEYRLPATSTATQNSNYLLEKINEYYKLHQHKITTTSKYSSNSISTSSEGNYIAMPIQYAIKEILLNYNTLDQIKLKYPIIFEVTYEDNNIYFTSKKYNIYAIGKNIIEVETDIYNEFKYQYNLFVTEKDSDLSEDAKELKRNLQDIIG